MFLPVITVHKAVYDTQHVLRWLKNQAKPEPGTLCLQYRNKHTPNCPAEKPQKPRCSGYKPARHAVLVISCISLESALRLEPGGCRMPQGQGCCQNRSLPHILARGLMPRSPCSRMHFTPLLDRQARLPTQALLPLRALRHPCQAAQRLQRSCCPAGCAAATPRGCGRWDTAASACAAPVRTLPWTA